MSSSKLIDGKQLTAFERWELPHMGGQKPKAKGKIEEVGEGELRPPTADELAAIREAARKEGLTDGLEQGRKQGLAAGKKHIDETVNRLEKIIHAFGEPLEAVDEAVEEELLALAMAVARQIIRREIQQDPQQILAVVREAMGELPSAARQVRIFLHPDDASLVRETFVSSDDEQRPWKIQEDIGLGRGGCRIESQTSRIDASVEKRLNHILSNLLGGMRSGDSDTAAEGAGHDGQT
jgi:flagellar assembly protein FliH